MVGADACAVHVGTLWWEADAMTNNELISIRQRALPKLH